MGHFGYRKFEKELQVADNMKAYLKYLKKELKQWCMYCNKFSFLVLDVNMNRFLAIFCVLVFLFLYLCHLTFIGAKCFICKSLFNKS